MDAGQYPALAMVDRAQGWFLFCVCGAELRLMHVWRGQRYGAWFQSAAASRGRGSVVVGGAHPVPLLDVMPNGAFPAMLTMSPHCGSGASRMSGATRRRALHTTPPLGLAPPLGGGGGRFSPPPLPCLSCPFGFVRDATDAGPAGCRERCVVRCESLCLCLCLCSSQACCPQCLSSTSLLLRRRRQRHTAPATANPRSATPGSSARKTTSALPRRDSSQCSSHRVSAGANNQTQRCSLDCVRISFFVSGLALRAFSFLPPRRVLRGLRCARSCYARKWTDGRGDRGWGPPLGAASLGTAPAL